MQDSTSVLALSRSVSMTDSFLNSSLTSLNLINSLSPDFELTSSTSSSSSSSDNALNSSSSDSERSASRTSTLATTATTASESEKHSSGVFCTSISEANSNFTSRNISGETYRRKKKRQQQAKKSQHQAKNQPNFDALSLDVLKLNKPAVYLHYCNNKIDSLILNLEVMLSKNYLEQVSNSLETEKNIMQAVANHVKFIKFDSGKKLQAADVFFPVVLTLGKMDNHDLDSEMEFEVNQAEKMLESAETGENSNVLLLVNQFTAWVAESRCKFLTRPKVEDLWMKSCLDLAIFQLEKAKRVLTFQEQFMKRILELEKQGMEIESSSSSESDENHMENQELLSGRKFSKTVSVSTKSKTNSELTKTLTNIYQEYSKNIEDRDIFLKQFQGYQPDFDLVMQQMGQAVSQVEGNDGDHAENEGHVAEQEIDAVERNKNVEGYFCELVIIRIL